MLGWSVFYFVILKNLTLINQEFQISKTKKQNITKKLTECLSEL